VVSPRHDIGNEIEAYGTGLLIGTVFGIVVGVILTLAVQRFL